MGASSEWAIQIHNDRMENDAEYAERYEAARAEYYAVRVDDAAADAAAENEYYAALQDQRDQQQSEEQQNDF